jgi:hypothetical protein
MITGNVPLESVKEFGKWVKMRDVRLFVCLGKTNLDSNIFNIKQE